MIDSIVSIDRSINARGPREISRSRSVLNPEHLVKFVLAIYPRALFFVVDEMEAWAIF